MVIDLDDVDARWVLPPGCEHAFVWTGNFSRPRWDAPGTFGERFVPPPGETNISILVVEIPDAAHRIDPDAVRAAVGGQAPEEFLGLTGKLRPTLLQGYPGSDGVTYFLELVPSAEVVGCEYATETGADGEPIVTVTEWRR